MAGALCVAFVNTVGARPNNRQIGASTYAELLSWGQQAGVLTASETQAMTRRAAEQPEEAEAVYQDAARLRLALFRLYVAVGAARELPAQDLRIFNQALGSGMAAACLVPGEDGLVWDWSGEGDAPARLLWPVVHSAAELFTSLAGRPAVRQCAAKGCTLFFVDRSPSQRRTWCEMKTCGHRENALAHYRRRYRKPRSIER